MLHLRGRVRSCFLTKKLKRGGACRWRVCYQRGIPRLVWRLGGKGWLNECMNEWMNQWQSWSVKIILEFFLHVSSTWLPMCFTCPLLSHHCPLLVLHFGPQLSLTCPPLVIPLATFVLHLSSHWPHLFPTCPPLSTFVLHLVPSLCLPLCPLLVLHLTST